MTCLASWTTGRPDEYDPEMEDFARLIAAGELITPEVVATVSHKWFGYGTEEAAGEPDQPTPVMEALAADLQAVANRLTPTA